MRNLDKYLRNRTIDYDNLIKYGFLKKNDIYVYEAEILNGEFKVIISINNDIMTAKLIETAFEDEYMMVDVEDATGEFVGKVKEKYENVISDVINNCTTYEIFNGSQTKQIIQYVNKKYGDKLEYLWKKFPNNAIWRNSINKKWYALLLTIPKNKLGFKTDEIIEIIDLRYQKKDIETIIDNQKIHPGYHMNKNSWITIILDESTKTEIIYKLIDNSYDLSLLKK